MGYETYGLTWVSWHGSEAKPLYDHKGKRETVKARSEREAMDKGARRYRGANVLIGATLLPANVTNQTSSGAR